MIGLRGYLCILMLICQTAWSANPPHPNLTILERAFIAEQKEITIAFDGDYAPYSFQNEQGEFIGIAVDFTREITQRAGLKLNIHPDGSWKRLYKAAQERKIDVIATLVDRPERKEWFTFTRPYISLAQYIITTKNGPAINDRTALAGKRVALVRGYSTTRYILEEFPTVDPYYVDNLTQALEAVSTGKAQVTVAAMGMAQHLIAKRSLSNLRFAFLFGQGMSEQRFGVRNDKPLLATILDKMLASISEAERLQIYQRWSRPEIAKVEIISSLPPTLVAEKRQKVAGPVELTVKEQQWLKTHPVIRIGIDAGFAPYAFVDDKGDFQGVAADFADTISQMLGIKMEMVPGLSWPEIIQASKDKTLDVITTASHRPEREAFLNFSQGYIPTPLVIMTRSDDPRVKKRGDIANLKLALVKGYNASKSVIREFNQAEVLDVGSPIEGLQAVSLGQADAYVGVLGINVYQAQRNGITNLKVAASFDLETNYQRYGVRKDWPILATILDKALDAIPEKEAHRILNKWVPIDQPQQKEVAINLTQEERQWLKDHPVIRTATDINWAPVEYVDEKGEFLGISADYIYRLQELLGVKFKVAKELNWAQSFEAYREGDIDLFTSLRETPERKREFAFSKPYVSFPIAIFSGAETPYIGNMEELNGRRVGVVKGYATEELLTTNHPLILLKTANDTAQALELLSKGEIDAFVGNILVTGYYISKQGLTHIKVAGETPYRYDQSFGIRKDWQPFISILNKAVAALPEEERQRIYNRWVSVRYEQGFDYGLLWKLLVIMLIIFSAFLYWNRHLSNLNHQLVLAHKQEEQARSEAEAARSSLEKANTQLKELDKLKSMFIASMSHELRTPLNSIIGFSGLMLQGISGDLTEKQQDSLERINRSGNHLLGLISDVIDISKIEAGRIEAFPETFLLKELIDEAMETIQPQADSKGLQLNVQAELWPEMVTDRKRLLQCLLNYLSNGVKFTEMGAITLSVSGDKDIIEIKVSDTGIGIAAEDIPKLFEAFERLETHLRVKAGGTGLGLYLTKKITTELLQGTIFVESRMGHGSTFGLRLPTHLIKSD